MGVFTVIWAGQLVSTLGSGLTSFALGVWIYEVTGSATLFAVNLVIWTLPNLAASPLAGVLTDRWDRRRVMLLSDSGAALGTLFVAAVLLTGQLQTWHVFLATFVNSAFSAFQWPAYSAATSLLVPEEHLGRAGGMTQIGDAIGWLVTPAVAGALYVTAGLGIILVIDAFTYLVALATLAAVRFPAPPATADGASGRGSFWQEALFGWTFIRQRPGLLGLLAVFAVLNFLLNSTYTLLTPMVLDLASPAVLGTVNAIGGVGMLLGTLLMSAWGGPRRRIFGIIGAEMAIGVFLVLVGVRPSIPLIAVAGAGMGLALPVSGGCSQAIWQSRVPPDVQGRVFAIRRMIAFSVLPLAFAVAGPLAEGVFEPAMAAGGRLTPLFGPWIGSGPGRGIGLMCVLGGCLYVLTAAVILVGRPIRQLELTLPNVLRQGA